MKEQMLKILTEVSKGFKNPEIAQSELLGLFSVTNRFLFEWDVDSTVEKVIILAKDELAARKEFISKHPNTTCSIERL